jgi:hypothetical protein
MIIDLNQCINTYVMDIELRGFAVKGGKNENG